MKGGVERLAIKGILWVLIVFLVGVAVLLAGATWEVRGKQKTAYTEKENARAQYEETQERQAALEARVLELSHERGMEEEFRERFPVAREGEEVVVLVDAETPVVDTVPEKPKGFWGTLRSWFKI